MQATRYDSHGTNHLTDNVKPTTLEELTLTGASLESATDAQTVTLLRLASSFGTRVNVAMTCRDLPTGYLSCAFSGRSDRAPFYAGIAPDGSAHS